VIEEIYKRNIEKLKPKLDKANFPGVIRLCREMMGLKQFAAAEYLGLERHRYKKIECGDMPRGAYDEELIRLSRFFSLDHDWLVAKHDKFLQTLSSERKEVSRNVWDTVKSARGFSDSREDGGNRRISEAQAGA